MEFLKHPIHRLMAMNAVGAVYFVSCAVACYGLNHSGNEGTAAAARWLVCIPLLVGLLQLVEIPPGILPDVDGLLYAGMLQSENQADLPIGRSATYHLATT
jgi:hypothetical protein